MKNTDPMRTRKITLWYTIDRDGKLVPLKEEAVARKETWLKELGKRARADQSPMMVAVEYRLSNPEVERIRKFFNGPVVEYYAIQNDNVLTGEVAPERLKRYREQILDEVLGFDVELLDRTVRRRKSTADYTDTQDWTDFLETLKETLFDPNGYEMPDSKAFWDLAKSIGYDQARAVNIQKLQERLQKKTAP